MLSAFEIIGPPMVGPSSSHTAGACRLGLMARALLGEVPRSATLELHGSFAATGVGHATDRALVAGLLGFKPDDERLKDALTLAAEHGLDFEFKSVDLGDKVHPNSVRIELRGASNSVGMIGSSVGGGAIVVVQIDEYSTQISGALETLVLWHSDTSGFLARVVSVCGCVELNIASVRTSRQQRGQEALTTLEVDGVFQSDILSVLRRSQGVRRLAHLPKITGF